MILQIFLTLLLLSLFWLALAYFYDKNNTGNGLIFVRIISWGMLFTVFNAGFFGGIEYQTGENVTITAGWEATEYTHTTYTNYTFGFFMAVLAAVGFISCFFDLKGPGWF